MKKLTTIFLTLALCLGMLAVPAAAADSVDVYVTISSAGTLVAAREQVTVTDADGDGALTINDALYCAHETLCEGGAEAGYAYGETEYGISLNRLWGVENGGSYGYYLNDTGALSMSDPVKTGDCVSAFSYADLTGWSDAYAYFDKPVTAAAVGERVTLTLMYSSGYDENWNQIFEPCAGATVTVGGREYTTDENGAVELTFDKAGTYVVTAFSRTVTLVPPAAVVEVGGSGNSGSGAVTGGGEEKPGQEAPADTGKQTDHKAGLKRTAQHCLEAVPAPGEGAHWLVLALAAGEFELPEGYLEAYGQAMAKVLQENGGVLNANKYTEYSRTVIGITAAGGDARDVGGYDLIDYISDYDSTRKQGLNGPIYALLALDSGDYASDTREQYLEYILSRQLEDGGWAFSGKNADTDMTAIALQALAGYRDRADVAAAVEKGVEQLSLLQAEDGSYASYGVAGCESTAQVILALCELGISLDDPRFVKGGNTLLDDLMAYQLANGAFGHEKGGKANGVATEQALLAMVAAKRQADGMGGVYALEERYAPARFTDIVDHWAEEEILACVDAGLFLGTGDRQFSPEAPMSRAMLVTVLWRMDGEKSVTGGGSFTDVAEDAWYTEAVRWAQQAGITDGFEDGSFGVNESVTRQQMALFLYRYAAYKKLDVTGNGDLSGYADASEVGAWAQQAMGWANEKGYVTGSEGRLTPKDAATRAQVATILMRFTEDME